MCAKSDQSINAKSRLRELLASDAQTLLRPCPDAEAIAAFVDQGLPAGERNELERHFASCNRCQIVLANLGAEPPLVEQPESLLLTTPILDRAERPKPKSKWLWWLVPALASAAAVLFWVVLRPSSPATAVTET